MFDKGRVSIRTHDGVSNHQPHDCLLKRLFRRRSKKKIKAPRHWPLCGEFTGDRKHVPCSFHLLEWNDSSIPMLIMWTQTMHGFGTKRAKRNLKALKNLSMIMGLFTDCWAIPWVQRGIPPAVCVCERRWATRSYGNCHLDVKIIYFSMEIQHGYSYQHINP